MTRRLARLASGPPDPWRERRRWRSEDPAERMGSWLDAHFRGLTWALVLLALCGAVLLWAVSR